MRWLTHWSASVQKNHDIYLLGSLVFVPLGVYRFDFYVTALLLMAWLSLVSALTLYAKVHIHQTSRVAPTEKIWLVTLATCLGSLIFSFIEPQLAGGMLSALLPLIFLAVLYDRVNRFRMARLRISRRRQQQARWRDAKRLVLTEWKDRLRWLAGVQHDMRQPLHALGLLISHPTLSSQERLEPVLGQISSCQRWLFELAENTMEATRFELGECRKHQIESVSSVTLCEGIASWIDFLARSKGLAFETRIAEGSILTDIRRLKRVLGNLVFNAVEHTYEGYVRLEYSRRGGVHRFQVSDTGPGIDEDVLDFSTNRGAFGCNDLPKTGIGLYVVKKLCHEMSWNISLESTAKCGTTFVLELADRIAARVEESAPTNVKKVM